MTGCIVALGGGGFSMEPENPRLDLYILSKARVPTPRVVFIGTASGDSLEYRLRFYQAFAKLDCRPAHLDIFNFDRQTGMADMLLAADVIYVGGGNTPAMMAVWRVYGVPAMLRAALDGGSVLAGISAGGNCWFEQGVSDGLPGGGMAEGLGFIGGAFCPHFNGEGWRRPFVEQLIADGHPPVGFACDDSAALLHDAAGNFIEAVASVEARHAHRWADGRLLRLETRLLV